VTNSRIIQSAGLDRPTEATSIREITRTVNRLNQRELNGSLLSAVQKALAASSNLEKIRVSVQGQDRTLAQTVASADFAESLTEVYDSWLAGRLVDHDWPRRVRHEELLRAASVALTAVMAPHELRDVDVSERLKSTRITEPHSWTPFAKQRREAIAAPANAVAPKSRAEELHDLRARARTLARQVEAIEVARAKLFKSYAAWASADTAAPAPAGVDPTPNVPPAAATPGTSNGGSTPAPRARPVVSANFLENFVKGLGPSVPNTVKRSILDFGQDATGAVDDLEATLDYETDPICTEIQAIEDAIDLDLPEAPEPSPKPKPPLITAAGIGDLIVARERHLRYGANEIAHIENVLPGERKVRSHDRFDRTETITETETLTVNESEKDLQTTDRSELQTQLDTSSQTDISTDISASYGTVQGSATLNAGFQRSESEARSETNNVESETVSKAVERSREQTRALRRSTVLQEVREINKHTLDNTVEGVGSQPTPLAGMYLWVEDVREIQLRHYGTRMMVEFHIPEPAVSLLERQQLARQRAAQTLPPFDIHPTDIQADTYMCYAKRFGATDLVPPPPFKIKVPWTWNPAPQEEAERSAEQTETDIINVPDGYQPLEVFAIVSIVPNGRNQPVDGWGEVTSTADTRPDVMLAVGDLDSPLIEGRWPIDFTTGWKMTTDPTYKLFLLPTPADQGVPVSLRAVGAWDAAITAHAVLTCTRTEEARAQWQLDTWASLRAAHDARAQELERDRQLSAFDGSFGVQIAGQPASVNRETERTELRKWAIQAMRQEHFDFNPIVNQQGLQEIDVTDAEGQAAIVRFFEEAFEWDEMTYFLYPYYWARRDTWQLRSNQQSVDATHLSFLQAGAARVIVPVTPGFDQRVLCLIGQAPIAAAAAGSSTPLDLPCDPLAVDPIDGSDQTGAGVFLDLAIDILTDRHDDLVRGSGTLAVQTGSDAVTISEDSRWLVGSRDLGRELFIDGDVYSVGALDGNDPKRFILDRPYTGGGGDFPYATGSVPYGPPWTVSLPTTLVVLKAAAGDL
jgi:hypothetical protein